MLPMRQARSHRESYRQGRDRMPVLTGFQARMCPESGDAQQGGFQGGQGGFGGGFGGGFAGNKSCYVSSLSPLILSAQLTL